jgi:hypothetical protein
VPNLAITNGIENQTLHAFRGKGFLASDSSYLKVIGE